jgi:predicted dehydrogenase
VAAAERKNVKVAVAHRNVYHPVLPVLKQQLQEGLIGRVLEIRLRAKEDHRGGGEDLWVLGTHLFNLADFLEGPPLLGSARVLQNGKPVIKADVFDSILEAGTREAGFGVQIIGNQGIVDLRIDKDPLVHLLRGSPFKPTLPSREWLPVTTGGVDSPEPIEGLGRDLARHVVQGRDLIEAMRKDRDPLCDARAARRTIEMVAAVFESHRRGGAEVAIPLAERGNPLARL